MIKVEKKLKKTLLYTNKINIEQWNTNASYMRSCGFLSKWLINTRAKKNCNEAFVWRIKVSVAYTPLACIINVNTIMCGQLPLKKRGTTSCKQMRRRAHSFGVAVAQVTTLSWCTSSSSSSSFLASMSYKHLQHYVCMHVTA